jgi:hypothetical protein
MSSAVSGGNIKALFIYTGIALLALGLVGCGPGDGDRTLEETVEQTYEVEPGATLSVSNVDGCIRVYGAPTTKIQVQAIKKAFSAERLAKIDIKVSARRDAVSIQTKYPPKKTWGLGDRSGTVDYTLIVPETCTISKLDLDTGEILVESMRAPNVEAHLGNGRLFVHKCFGNIHLRADNGGIDIYYDWWEDGVKFLIDAAIENGGVRAFLPLEASFHLIAEAEDGRIGNDFAEQEQRHAGGVSKIDSVIGTGAEVELRLRARNGNIKIGEISY